MQFMPLNAEYNDPKQWAFGLSLAFAMLHLNLRHYQGLVGVGIGNLIPLPNLIQREFDDRAIQGAARRAAP